jgi:hypothetical protein
MYNMNLENIILELEVWLKQYYAKWQRWDTKKHILYDPTYWKYVE